MDEEKNDQSKTLFALATLLTRKWEVLFNREQSRGDLTLKQLLLLIVVENSFDYDPAISQVADALATSHQNVKAISLLLEKKGFVDLYKDENDKRVIRIKSKKGKEEYWEDRKNRDDKLLEHLFFDIDLEELKTAVKVISKLDNMAIELIKG